MITLNSFDNQTCYKILEIEPSEIKLFTGKRLPIEVENYILSFINTWDFQSVVQVSKTFNVLALNTFKKNEIFYLQNYADLVEKATKNDLIEAICSLGKTRLLKSANLKEIKSTVIDLKDQILEIFKTLDKEELLNLKVESRTLNKSHFFSNMIFLAALYHQMDKLEELDPSPLRDKEFVIICEQLCRMGGNLVKATEAASKISDKNCRIKTLEMIEKKSSAKNLDEVSCEIKSFIKKNKTKKRNNCIIS